MKKSTVVVGLVAVFLLVAGSAVWLSLNNPSNTANESSGTPSGGSTEGPSTSDTTDLAQETEVQITIRDMSFSPASVKIKKGAKVTWTNNDTVGHNIVADNPSSSGGLPSTHPLLGQGETFSHTFETVGTFAYHCTPHPFMKGTIEVVD
jgi:amicyanin